MDINNILSWVTSIIVLVGMWAFGRKLRWAWIFYLVAQILSLWLYYRLSLWGFVILNIILVYLSVDGFMKWGKDKSDGGNK